LRHYGQPDSRYAMPGWVYGLRCRFVSTLSKRELDATPDENKDEYPNPWCRFRAGAAAAEEEEKADSRPQRYWQLYAEAEHLMRLVRAASPKPASNKLRYQFKTAIGTPDNVLPDEARLRAAVDYFYRMPVAEQAVVLNGWKSDPKPHDRAPDALATVLPWRRCLSLSCDDGKVRGDFDSEPSDSEFTVLVKIAEGATKGEALRELDRILQEVEQCWDTLIRGDPDDDG